MARPEVTGRRPGVSKGPAEPESGPPSDDEDDEFQQPPPSELSAAQSTKSQPIRGPPVERAAYTVKEFCAAYRISEDMFWKMRRNGWAPKLMKVGTRVLVSIAAAEQW